MLKKKRKQSVRSLALPVKRTPAEVRGGSLGDSDSCCLCYFWASCHVHRVICLALTFGITTQDQPIVRFPSHALQQEEKQPTPSLRARRPIKQAWAGCAQARALVGRGEEGVQSHYLRVPCKPSSSLLLHPWELPGRASELPAALTVWHRGAEVSQD